MVLFRFTNLKSCKDKSDLKPGSLGLIVKKRRGEKQKDRYLDPGKEDNDGGNVVELDLQVGQRLKAGMSRVVFQQPFEENSNHRCPGDVHDDRNNAQLGKEGEHRSESGKTTSIKKMHNYQ